MNRSTRKAATLSALAAGVVASGVMAANKSDEERAAKALRHVSRGWNVIAKAVPIDPMTLTPGSLALQQELQPVRVVTLRAGVVDPKSKKPVLQVGAVLFVLQAASGTVACELNSPSYGKGRFDIRWCLKDSDGDNRFEQLAAYVGLAGAMPVVAGYWPKRPKLLTEAVEYAAPNGGTPNGRNYSVALRYSGVNIYNQLIFDAIVSDGERTDVVQSLRLAKKAPAKVSLAGAEAELLSVGEGQITLKVHNAIAAGTFGIFPVDSAFGGAG